MVKLLSVEHFLTKDALCRLNYKSKVYYRMTTAVPEAMTISILLPDPNTS